MKNRYFHYLKESIKNKTNTWELFLWILVHAGFPIAFLISLFLIGPVGVNTSLFDMLPRSNQVKAVMEADTLLGERNGREVIILSAAPLFEEAKKGAVLLYEKYKDSADFENISFYFDSSVMDDFNRFLFDYRFVIAGNETLELLDNGLEEEIAYDALSRAFGVFNFFSLDKIDKDPFLLAERRMEEFLTSSIISGSMTLKDDVIAAEKDGISFVLLRMTLAPGRVSLQADKNIIGKIYSDIIEIKSSIENLEFYCSGIPFHSYESSSGAQREISLISTITLMLILFVFLYFFRSPVPVFFSVMAIGISLGIAVTTALLFFREIHIITFVFGTTLIGTCVDYSVHFFINWKSHPEKTNGAKIRASVLKNITMSFISTQVCFIAFFLAPFPILKQFAVFSIAGLLSSYLTFFCIYPRLKVPQIKKPIVVRSNKIGLLLFRYKPVLISVFILSIAVLFIFNYPAIKIKNDITSLYTMSDSMLESEIKTAQVLDYGSSGWYFIVSGLSPEETLENEEKLTARLNQEIKMGNMDSFLATSMFVPSIAAQKETYQKMKALLPLVPMQFEYLGFPQWYASEYIKEFEVSENYCYPQDAPQQAGISNLWIGQIGNSYYSCVMPMKAKDEVIFRVLAEEYEFVHFINKAKDIGNDMDMLTKTMLLLFLAAYIIVSVIIFLSYPRKDSIKICSVPVILVVVSLAVLAVNKIPIGFFSVAALVLVFGLSLDYIFFMTGKKPKEEKKLTLLGVVLAFLTTMLSFGALSFSSFMPVHIFGLTVCAGLGAAFISALILQARAEDENKRISGSN